ncbi:MAG: hypothetical protein K0R54_708 [Clostridiaceae bacterium]|jgi:hypothetical protein|nr:hypothetical protein [Clostridiaceae bacterium]
MEGGWNERRFYKKIKSIYLKEYMLFIFCLNVLLMVNFSK